MLFQWTNTTLKQENPVTMKPIAEFEFLDHGIQHEQYFPGCGLTHSQYAAVATGIGDYPSEAIDDALENLAQQDWETEGMEERIREQEFPFRRTLPARPRVRVKDEDCHYYVSIRVR